jgi:two-component system sensor histidine kinase SenX3
MSWFALALAFAAFLLGVQLGRRREAASRRVEPRDESSVVVPDIDHSPAGILSTSPGLQQVLDVLPVGIIVVDVAGVEVTRNKMAEEITGLRHLDLLVDDAAESLLTAARQGSFGAHTLSLFGPPQKTIELTAFPLADGALVAMEDISEKVRLDQVRTDFVANISHELKTPVGAISILAETLAGEVTDESTINLASRIVNEAQRMANTINDLMDLSRIEKAESRVHGPVDLVEIVHDSVRRVQPLAEREGIMIDVHSTDGPVLVDGDFRQLVSAIGNVVDNAVKYSDEGSTVSVSIFKTPETSVVQVEDHGIGISAEHLDRIFERFYRADKARSRDTGGTGLGLSIVRNIVTQHGGEVNVESLEGKGSTFRLIFPLKSPSPSGTMNGNDYVVRN